MRALVKDNINLFLIKGNIWLLNLRLTHFGTTISQGTIRKIYF